VEGGKVEGGKGVWGQHCDNLLFACVRCMRVLLFCTAAGHNDCRICFGCFFQHILASLSSVKTHSLLPPLLLLLLLQPAAALVAVARNGTRDMPQLSRCAQTTTTRQPPHHNAL